jgi:hypothetical protein
MQTWDLWFPQAGATGVAFARCRVDGRAVGHAVLVHAAPPVLDVWVRDETGAVIAQGHDLKRQEPGPMSLLMLEGSEVRLEDHWPTPADLGRLVILPGGEAGILLSWWHAEDRSEWRWRIEFYNHR